MVVHARPVTRFGSTVLGSAAVSKLSTLKLFIRHFTPSWMVITMGTGSMAITVMLFPFSFPGQWGLALAAWILNVILFTIFLCLLIARAVCYPSSARELLEHPNQSLFFGCLPMTISVLTGGVIVLLVPRYQEPALTAAHVLTWINLPIVAVVALLVPIYMFSVHDLNMFTMTALWLVPVIPGTAAASVTGATSKAVVNHDKAIALLYLGVCMLAVGLGLTYHVLTIYYQRLVCHNLPPREVIVSSFIPVGATGMGGWALLNLASAAEHHMRAYYDELPNSPEFDASDAWLDVVIPACMAAAGVMGLCLWAYAGWWLVLAVSSVGQTLRQGIPINLGWWGAVFPLGTFAGATLALGHVFHSKPFEIFGALVGGWQIAVWLFVACMTVYHGWAGNLFHPPCLSLPASPADQPLSRQASILEDRLDQQPSVLLNTTAVRHLQHHMDSFKRLESVLQGGPDHSMTHEGDPGLRIPSSSALADLGLLNGGMFALMRSASAVDDRGVHGYLPAVPAALLRADTLERQLRFGGDQQRGVNNGGHNGGHGEP